MAIFLRALNLDPIESRLATKRVLKEVFHTKVQTPNVSFGLICKECGKNGHLERFRMNAALNLEDKFCSRGDHRIDDDNRLLITSKEQVSPEENNLMTPCALVCFIIPLFWILN